MRIDAGKPIKIPFPIKGVDQDGALTDQPPLTTRRSRNCRAIDAPSGRSRGGQRGGWSKHIVAPAGDGPVQVLATSVRDGQAVEYRAIQDGGDLDVTWSQSTPKGEAVRDVVADAYGNAYALEGQNGLLKYNPEGNHLWTVDLPTQDETHECISLAITPSGTVFAAVGLGERPSASRVWAYTPDPENDVEQLWELQPDDEGWSTDPDATGEGGFVVRMLYRSGRLYTIENRPERAKAVLRVWSLVESAVPQEEWSRFIPYPCNDLEVLDDGSILVSCEPNPTRGIDPTDPDTGATSTDWYPGNDTDGLFKHGERLWAEFDARRLEGLADGAPVLRWPDLSGNGRDLYQNLDHKPPTYERYSLAGLPGVRFNGFDQALWSGKNETTNPTAAESQRTIVPAYKGCQWAMVMVVTFDPEDSEGVIFGQPGMGKDGGSRIISANRGDKSTGFGFETKAGWIKYNERGNPNDPPQGNQRESGGWRSCLPFEMVNPNNAAIITIIMDGGLNPAGSATPGQRTVFRVNGQPIDLYESPTQNTTNERSFLGYLPVFPDGGWFNGTIHYLATFRDFADPATGLSSVFQAPDLETGSLLVSQPIDEATKMEGYAAHGFGLQGLLPQAGDDYPHPFALAPPTTADPDPPPGVVPVLTSELNSTDPLLAKFRPNTGQLRSVFRGAGVGYGCAKGPDGAVYTMGPKVSDAPVVGGPDRTVLRRLIDQGDTWSEDEADGAWAISNEEDPTWRYPRLAVDDDANLYAPIHSAANTRSLRKITAAGASEWELQLPSSQRGFAIALEAGVVGESIGEPEYVFVGAEGPTGLHRLRIVRAVRTGAPPRELVHLVVVDGNVRKYQKGASPELSILPGGEGALDPGARLISAAPIYRVIPMTDGTRYVYYDSADGAVKPFASTSAGRIHPRCELLVPWRGRLIAARPPDSPHVWFMSRQGDPFNWDPAPPLLNAQQAVVGADSRAGAVTDVINSIAPLGRDYCLFGTDHSLQLMAGDPMAGGEFDVLSTEIGMSFGRPWAKDPDGRLYFHSLPGGIFAYAPGGLPVRISTDRLERELLDSIDLSRYRVEMVWNRKAEGLEIVQVPYGPETETVLSWFLDVKNGGFWTDERESYLVQPSTVGVFDGDQPDDRAVLMGTQDGRLLEWDPDARDDDGHTIRSHVLIGPISAREQGLEMLWSDFQVTLASDQEGATLEVYGSNSVDDPGPPRLTFELRPGMNLRIIDRVSAPYVWLGLRNGNPRQRWAFEQLAASYYPIGIAGTG